MPQCLSPSSELGPPPLYRKGCAPLRTKGGTHSPAGEGGPNSDEEKKSGTLYILWKKVYFLKSDFFRNQVPYLTAIIFDVTRIKIQANNTNTNPFWLIMLHGGSLPQISNYLLLLLLSPLANAALKVLFCLSIICWYSSSLSLLHSALARGAPASESMNKKKTARTELDFSSCLPASSLSR